MKVVESVLTKLLTKIGITFVLVIGIVAIAIYLINYSGEALKNIAQSFSSGKVVNEFYDYITKIEGMNRLQVASLHSVDTFSKSDSKKIIWDLIDLPDVVIEIRVPVEYTYFVDLKKKWEFKWEENEQSIIAISPRIECGTPAADISKMKIIEREGSFLRDVESVREKLQSEMSMNLVSVAPKKIPFILEAARSEIKVFLNNWFFSHYFKDSKIKPKEIIVFFENENISKETKTSLEIKENNIR